MIRLKHLRVANFKSLRDIDLAFPDAGSILIEGLNESGKSTLFEAVYFALYGRPLVAESGIESTIRYGAQEAFVELGLSVDATEMVIARHIRARRPNRAELKIVRPGEPAETVNQLAAANRRIVDELRLDGDTLLNSCFVEQKKLQRLEGLTAAARRESLLRLLNLDSLTHLEDHFKLGRQDEEAIQAATRRRDLAQIRADIPAREADLAKAERRLAARRILAALGRIDAHRANIADQQVRREQLQAEQETLKARLERVLRLTQLDQVLATIVQTEARRRIEAGAEASARQAINEVVRIRDVDLPALVQRLSSVQDLLARAQRLEQVEGGLGSLRDGAAAWSEAADLDARAARFEEQCAAVGEQVRVAAELRETLQRATGLGERLAELSRAEAAVSDLTGQAQRLEARALQLPAERQRVTELETAAARLAEAEDQAALAVRRRDAALAFVEARSRLEAALAERAEAAADLEARATELRQAQVELEEARAARAQSPAPILRSWIRARTALERAADAQREESTVAAQAAEAQSRQQQAMASASAAGTRGTLMLGGAALGLLGGVGVLLALGSPVGIALAALGLILGVLGARTLATRGSLGGLAEEARTRQTAAQQRLAELRAVVVTSAESQEQLDEAAALLREMRHSVPTSLADAQQKLLAAQEREGEQQQAEERERLAKEAVDRLGREHGEAQVRLGGAESAVAGAQQHVAGARQQSLAADDAYPGLLIADAEAGMSSARERLTQARAQASSLLADPTPERLRIEASGVARLVEEGERQVRELPELQQRLASEQDRSEHLAQAIAAERQWLTGRVGSLAIGIEITELADLQQALRERLAGVDEQELHHTQNRLNAEIGAARETAQRQREAARQSWRSASTVGEHAQSEQPDDAPGTVGAELARIASAAAETPESLAARVDALAATVLAERERLEGRATGLELPLDLARLNSTATELGAERRQLDDRVGRLSLLEEQHARAAATLAATDRALDSAWTDVQTRLGGLDMSHEGRDAPVLQERVQSELCALDELSTRSRLDAVIGELADADGAIRYRQAQIVQEQSGIQLRLAGVGLHADELNRAGLETVLPEVADLDLPDEPALEDERERWLGEIRHLKVTQQDLETQLDLAGVVLDLAEEQAALARLTRTRDIKKRATAIITTARTRMIDRVLPGTEQNLRLLLPQLTAERYYDAKLDADYRLSVWDSAAQRYVAKDIFSGGTRDQFSLALRLAFALATLPQELGTTPGFIFLDEPLSAFDAPRTEALVELLTRGEIAGSFAQIFLISHSRSFNPDLFSFYLHMEAGCVAETNLPRPGAATQPRLIRVAA